MDILLPKMYKNGTSTFWALVEELWPLTSWQRPFAENVRVVLCKWWNIICLCCIGTDNICLQLFKSLGNFLWPMVLWFGVKIAQIDPKQACCCIKLCLNPYLVHDECEHNWLQCVQNYSKNFSLVYYVLESFCFHFVSALCKQGLVHGYVLLMF